MHLAGRAVDDLGRGGDEDAHRDDGALADDHALDDFRARADEAIVLDDRRIGLQRLEHAADPDAAGKMDVVADLRAGADRHPGVDHRLGADIGAEIDEARHQDRIARDESGMAHDAAGHRAKPGVAKTVFAPALEFRRDLVPPGRAARAALDDLVVVEAEGKQHRLLQPLVDLPGARPDRAGDFLRDPRLAAVEQPSAFSTASRTSPCVPAPIAARSSKARSMRACNAEFDMGSTRRN